MGTLALSKMKDVIIVGAGGFGREVYGYVNSCIKAGEDWQIKGFIDDNLSSLDSLNYPAGILGSISDWQPSGNEVFVLALGDPSVKKIVVQKLLAKGAEFITLVHPSSYIGQNVEIGKGCVICPFCSITCDCQIGDFVTFNVSSGAGHDSKIGSWSTLSSHCDVTGHVSLGEGVFFASSVATVPSSKIGDWSKVGINSAVVGKVKSNSSVWGNPAVKI